MSLLPGMNERTSTIVAAWVDPRGAGSRDESGTRARIPGDASRHWRRAHNAPDRAAYGSAYAEDANACVAGAPATKASGTRRGRDDGARRVARRALVSP